MVTVVLFNPILWFYDSMIQGVEVPRMLRTGGGYWGAWGWAGGRNGVPTVLATLVLSSWRWSGGLLGRRGT